MILDIQSFGIGIGLVLTGWAAGLVVSYLFSISKGISNIGKKG